MKVKDLIAELSRIDQNLEVVGSEYAEEHEEYDVQRGEFCVARYYNSIDDDDGVVYVGLQYRHPN